MTTNKTINFQYYTFSYILVQSYRIRLSKLKEIAFFSSARRIWNLEFLLNYTQRRVSLIYEQRNNFFDLKKAFLIQKKFSLTQRNRFVYIKEFFLNQSNCTPREKLLWIKETSLICGQRKNFFDLKKVLSIETNQGNISLIHEQTKNFFDLNKVLSIQRNFLLSEKLDLFIIKNFFCSKKLFSSERNFYFEHTSKILSSGCSFHFWDKRVIVKIFRTEILNFRKTVYLLYLMLNLTIFK